MVQSSMPYGRVDAIAASNAKQPPHNVTLSRRATFGTERAFAERAMTPRDASRRAQSSPRASLAWNVPTRFTRAFGASRHHAQKLSWKASLHVRYGGANARGVLSRPPSPRGVDRVSIEVTTQMLAVLFGMPIEDNRKLARWSDLATGTTQTGERLGKEARRKEFMECLAYFSELWTSYSNKNADFLTCTGVRAG